MQYDLRDLFQAALALNYSESIVVPCADFKEVENVRMALYRELKKLAKISTDLAAEVRISRIIKGSYHAITLSKIRIKRYDAFVVSGEGKPKPVKFVEKKEKERMEQLMLEDGYTPEQIAEYKKKELENMPVIEGEQDDS